MTTSRSLGGEGAPGRMTGVSGWRIAVLVAGAAVLCGAIAVPPVALGASTIRVNTLSDTASGSDGHCSLREALTSADTNAASGGAAGECPAGTAGNTDVILFTVPGSITLSSPLPESNEGFTLDGGGTVTVSGNAKQWRGLIVNGGTVTIRRLTITQCAANYGGAILNYATLVFEDSTISSCDATIEGGAIDNQHGSVTIRRSTFTGNAGGSGGALANTADGTITVDRSTFTGNVGVTNGGAIYNQGDLTVTASTLSGDNHAVNGGAIYNTRFAEVMGSVVSGNRASGTGDGQGGGGIYSTYGLTVTSSQIDSNTGREGAGVHNTGSFLLTTSSMAGNQDASLGGAIFNEGALTVDRSTLRGNHGKDGGAILAHGPTTVRRSTISANTAIFGAGIEVWGVAAVRIANSTIVGNIAGTGGGIFVASDGSTVTISNATITGNQASTSSGGVGNQDGSVAIANSIIAGNTAPVAGQVALMGGVTTSLVVESAVGILSASGLADNGGPTKTVRLVDSEANPALDSGNATICGDSDVEGIDQRGVTRPTACDMGAVELEHTAPTVSAPRPQLRSGTTLSGSSERVTIAWTPSDAGGSGVKRYVVARSVNGGAWTTITSTLTSAALNQTLGKDKSFRYRVKPVDYDGNVGAWVNGPTFTTRLVQQTSSTISYGKTWTTASSSAYSGGSLRYAKVAGASASFTFTGRSIAFVSYRNTNRGSVKVYVTDANGTTVTVVSLAGAKTARYVAFARSWSTSGTRKIRIVTQSSARVDLDGFAVLK